MDFEKIVAAVIVLAIAAFVITTAIVQVVTPCKCDTVEVRIGEGGYRWLVCKKCGRKC